MSKLNRTLTEHQTEAILHCLKICKSTTIYECTKIIKEGKCPVWPQRKDMKEEH